MSAIPEVALAEARRSVTRSVLRPKPERQISNYCGGRRFGGGVGGRSGLMNRRK